MSSLRSRTFLAILLAALLPVGSVGLWARTTLVDQAESEHEQLLTAAVQTAQLTVDDRAATLRRSVQRLCDRDFVIDRLVLDLATDRFDADRQDQLVEVLPSMMRSLELDTLEVLGLPRAEGEARVLASGHSPGRTGASDGALARAIGSQRGELFVHRARVPGTSSQDPQEVLTTACAVDRDNVRLAILGGQFLKESFLGDLLSKDAAVRLRLVASDRPVDLSERLVREFRGSDGDVTSALVGMVDRGPLVRRLRSLDRGFFIAAALAVLLASALGLLLSLTFARPLRVLEKAAARVASGDWSSTLPVNEVGEVGRVLSAFNAMIHELATTRNQLLRAERIAAWRDIAQRIAHEIKNPLSPIQISIETMRKTYSKSHPEFPEIFEESTRTILEEVGRLRRIVEEFSKFARLPRPKPTEVDLRAVVEHVVGLHHGDAVDLATAFPEELPPIRADREQLTQVLVNLVQNGMDAARARHPSEGGRVTLRAKKNATGGVDLEIEDNGHGIPVEQRARVFEPYFTTKAGGTGLGLAIVLRILEEHGARIDVTTAPSGGALFQIVLRREGPLLSADASNPG